MTFIVEIFLDNNIELCYGLSQTRSKNMEKFIGVHKDSFFALCVEGVPADFPKMSFGGQISYRRKLEEFQTNSQKGFILTKGKDYRKAIREWISENHPKEFYGKWQKPSSSFHDDTLEIHFR